MRSHNETHDVSTDPAVAAVSPPAQQQGAVVDLTDERAPTSPWAVGYSRTIAVLSHINDAVIVTAIFVSLMCNFINVLMRSLFNTSLVWNNDLNYILLSVITFLGGAAYVYRDPKGMAFTGIVDVVRSRNRRAAELMTATAYWIVIAGSIAILMGSPTYIKTVSAQRLPTIGWSAATEAVWVLVGFVLIVLFTIRRLLAMPAKAVGTGFIVTAAFVAIIVGSMDGWLPLGDAITPGSALLGVIIVCFICGVQIPFVLAFGGMAYLVVSGLPMSATPSVFVSSSMSSVIILSIPFFVLAGAILSDTGMARRLVDLAEVVSRKIPGNLLVAAVGAIYAFSNLSGSKSADVAAIGSVMKDPLKERKYPVSESVAVIAATAGVAESIPPAIALLLLAAVTGISVSALFVAGFLPTAVVSIILIFAVIYRAKRGYMPHNTVAGFAKGEIRTTILKSIPALFVPVIILGGIFTGIATPLEASTFAVIYGVLAAVLFYRNVDAKTMWHGFTHGARLAGVIVLMNSAAGVFSQALVTGGIGDFLRDALDGITNQLLFMTILAGLMIIVGFVLEGFPAILVSAPILYPIALEHGIDPIYFGIVLTTAVGIGVFFPGVGVSYYLTCAVMESPVAKAFRASMFYNNVSIVGLWLIVLFPSITLLLPRWLGMG